MSLGGHEESGEPGFGALLRRYRMLAGLSQEALAERAGVSRRGVADLERGARKFPYPDTARRLADALDLDSVERRAFMAAGRRGSRSDESPARYGLPVVSSPIVGRRAEIDEVTGLADGARLLTLTGPPGIGKSRLGLELAHRTESVHRDGALVVELAPVADATLLPATIAAALGVSQAEGQSLAASLRQHVRTKQMLLVLDNCEHLIAACAHLADGLLHDAPGLRVLTTSREPLRIDGEVVWAVPPLTDVDAFALFGRHARAAGAASFTRDELVLVGEICARLDGLPLAIQLAAGHVPTLGVAQVRELLSDRLGFLAGGSRVDPPRHQTIRAALDWSFALLDTVEQKVMACLAAFHGGWNLEGAQAVCSRGDIPSSAVIKAVEGLVQKSLVGADDVHGERRYRFLETVREYATERLDAGEDAAEFRERHSAYVMKLAEAGASTRLGIRYPGDPARLRHEYANLRQALQWLLDSDRLHDGLCLCQALSGFWLSQGFLVDGQAWFARFLGREGGPPSVTTAASLYSWGRIVEYSGDLDQARELLERSSSISSDLGDMALWARAACGLGDLLLHRSDFAKALDLYRSAAEAAAAVGSTVEEAQALRGLGRVTGLMGEDEDSMHWLDQALALQRRLGDPWGVAYVLNESGQQARRLGQLQRARTLLEECHVLWKQSGTRMGERAAVMNLALVNLELGTVSRAASLAIEGLNLSREIGDDGSTTPIRCIEIAAQTLAAVGEEATAVLLTSAATQRRAVLGAPRPPTEQPEISRLLNSARQKLERPRFETVWASGLDMPIGVAVDLAVTELSSLRIQ